MTIGGGYVGTVTMVWCQIHSNSAPRGEALVIGDRPTVSVTMECCSVSGSVDGNALQQCTLPQPPSPPAHPSLRSPPVAGRCAGWCATSPKPVSVKCTYTGCSGCQNCVASLPPTQASPPPAAGRCAGWCASSPKPASVKCEFAGCSGCGFCTSI